MVYAGLGAEWDGVGDGMMICRRRLGLNCRGGLDLPMSRDAQR